MGDKKRIVCIMASDIEVMKLNFDDEAAKVFLKDSFTLEEKIAAINEWAKYCAAYAALQNRCGCRNTKLLKERVRKKTLTLHLLSLDKVEYYEDINHIDFKRLIEIENVKVAIYDDLKISKGVYDLDWPQYWEKQKTESSENPSD
ncbi:MAG: hypothetical protein IJQ31_11180 [Thermoguttaceae bacterium]|nr:hypothetical protein [Thermoguttaceae bacterium]